MAYGAILGQTSSGGKRVCRLVVGTSTSGWTEADCDYLCDGTADDVEINEAIQALPSTGGEIVILDGTYNITATIAMDRDNVKLSGNGTATILKRMWDSSFTRESVINISATNGGCCVENLQIDGNKTTYTDTGINSSGDNNIITGNICNNNDTGINLNHSNNSTITGNICNNNNDTGISVNSSDNNTIVGNICNNNGTGIDAGSSDNNTIVGNTVYDNDYGIYLTVGSGCKRNTISGNTCIRGSGESSDYTSSQHTIYIKGTSNSYNLFADNNIMGKNYVSSGGTSNTFVNNKYN